MQKAKKEVGRYLPIHILQGKILFRLRISSSETVRLPASSACRLHDCQYPSPICGSGIADCTLHDLRRSAITNWAQQLPIQVVQQLAGHSNITATIEYYLAVRPEDCTLGNTLVNKILAGVTID